MRNIPLSAADRADMLAVIGASAIDDLFADVPAAALYVSNWAQIVHHDSYFVQAGRPPLLTPETAAEFAQIHSIGHDLVARAHKAFGLGFAAVGDTYPVLGQGAFGHSGAAGSLAFADPRSGLAYGYNRRRYAFPGGAAPENGRLVAAVHAAVTAAR